MSGVQLDCLPVEILHRIFDYLDVQTIVFALRSTCKRFYLVSQSYNRYEWNFRSMSKANLRSICQFVSMSNVISLTLADEDRTRGQIAYFLSRSVLNDFTRLRSLNLIEIESTQLEIFLDFIHQTNLTHLAVDFLPLHLNRTRNFSVSRLSSAIAHPTLTHLQLNILSDHWDRLEWPPNEHLQSLQLVHSITLSQFSRILDQSTHLKKFILKEIPHCDVNDKLSDKTYPQLLSLTIDDCRIDIEKLDRCLSLTPSLKSLKLIGKGTLFDSSFNGYRWESLIQKKLLQLKTFEFFFAILIYSNYHSHHMNLLMTPFRAPFWSRDMRCSIVCDYITNSRKVLLYTVPICVRQFVFHTDYKKISLANFTRSNEENLMTNVTNLELQLTKEINRLPITEKNPLLFHHVTTLTLGNDGEWPSTSLTFLSKILDLSHIVHLSLSVNFFLESMTNLVEHLQLLFNQATNLQALCLFDYWPADNLFSRLETICSLISPNIKHLQIRVKNIDEMKFLLERLAHLTSVTFQYSQMLNIQREELIHSLAGFQRFSSIWNSENALHIWLGERKDLV